MNLLNPFSYSGPQRSKRGSVSAPRDPRNYSTNSSFPSPETDPRGPLTVSQSYTHHKQYVSPRGFGGEHPGTESPWEGLYLVSPSVRPPRGSRVRPPTSSGPTSSSIPTPRSIQIEKGLSASDSRPSTPRLFVGIIYPNVIETSK